MIILLFLANLFFYALMYFYFNKQKKILLNSKFNNNLTNKINYIFFASKILYFFFSMIVFYTSKDFKIAILVFIIVSFMVNSIIEKKFFNIKKLTKQYIILYIISLFFIATFLTFYFS